MMDEIVICSLPRGIVFWNTGTKQNKRFYLLFKMKLVLLSCVSSPVLILFGSMRTDQDGPLGN